MQRYYSEASNYSFIIKRPAHPLSPHLPRKLPSVKKVFSIIHSQAFVLGYMGTSLRDYFFIWLSCVRVSVYMYIVRFVRPEVTYDVNLQPLALSVFTHSSLSTIAQQSTYYIPRLTSFSLSADSHISSQPVGGRHGYHMSVWGGLTRLPPNWGCSDSRDRSCFCLNLAACWKCRSERGLSCGSYELWPHMALFLVLMNSTPIFSLQNETLYNVLIRILSFPLVLSQ